MDLFEAIESQRAVRHFRPDPIPDDALRRILRAATHAPSARNCQPWVFVVVRDAEVRAAVGRLYAAAWQQADALNRQLDGDRDIKERPDYPAMMHAVDHLARTLHEVPVIILAGLDTTQLGLMADDRGQLRAPQSAYASIFPAVQNLMLAARGLGIGSTLTTVFQAVEADLRATVGMPAQIHIAALIPLGYPTRAFRPTRRKPVDEIAFLDRWGNRFDRQC